MKKSKIKNKKSKIGILSPVIIFYFMQLNFAKFNDLCQTFNPL